MVRIQARQHKAKCAWFGFERKLTFPLVVVIHIKDLNHAGRKAVMFEDLLGIKVASSQRTQAQKDYRVELAKRLRSLRRVERIHVIPGRMNEKRNRSPREYGIYLAGLDGTLGYVRRGRIRVVVDIGAGTGRSIAALERSPKYNPMKFIGTGILSAPDIVATHYRLTPAELMRGFPDASVGAFLSVFGPTHYSDLPPVLERIHAVLAPDGLLKFAVMKSIPGHESNPEYAFRIRQITTFFNKKHYDFSCVDGRFPGRLGTFRIFLAVKPRTGAVRPRRLAASILEEDKKSSKKYFRGYLER